MRKISFISVVLVFLAASTLVSAADGRERPDFRKDMPGHGSHPEFNKGQPNGPRDDGPGQDEIRKMMQAMAVQKQQLEMKMHETEVMMRMKMSEFEIQKKEIELDRMQREVERDFSENQHKDKHGHVFAIICIIANLLMAVWVYQDIRKRNQGSGIWIVLSLIAGFFGTLLYLVARLGDNKE